MPPKKQSPTPMVKEWINDPIRFFVDVLGCTEKHIWSKMTEMIESVRDNKKTAVKAGHSVSKSYTAARLAVWFLYTHYPSTVITTAPTHTQVEQILWREIRSCIANAKVPLPGDITKTKVELEELWFAYGFSTKPDQGQENATKMQGYHNEHVLVIFDEAAGILPAIWQAKDGLIINKDKHRFLAIGNPTSAIGDFVDCFSDDEYNKVTISVLDTPNYKEGYEVVPGLAGREFEQDIISKYGKESNQYRSRIIGEIPDDDIDALIPLKWIEAAEERGKTKHPSMRHVKRGVVWDVADGGADLHVIKAFENKTEIAQIVLREKTVEEAEPHVWKLLREIDGNYIIVDADGIGRVAVQLLELSKDKYVHVVPFQGSSNQVFDEDKFRSRRDEGCWMMREEFEVGLLSISRNEQQRKELASLRLADHTRGFISMEKKSALRKRIGCSPDYADCIMMFCAEYDNLPLLELYEDEYAHTAGEKYYQFEGDPMAV